MVRQIGALQAPLVERAARAELLDLGPEAGDLLEEAVLGRAAHALEGRLEVEQLLPQPRRRARRLFALHRRSLLVLAQLGDRLAHRLQPLGLGRVDLLLELRDHLARVRALLRAYRRVVRALLAQRSLHRRAQAHGRALKRCIPPSPYQREVLSRSSAPAQAKVG
jgi:hypothetical protein